MEATLTLPPETRLDVVSLAEGLTRAGRLSAKNLLRLKGSGRVRLNPLVFLAEQKFPDLSDPGGVLDMPALLAFLSRETGQAVVDIDPLKIDARAIAEVMSQGFAERHNILAVAVTPEEVTVASTEPWISRWEKDLEHVVQHLLRLRR